LPIVGASRKYHRANISQGFGEQNSGSVHRIWQIAGGPLRLPPDVSGGPIDLTETAVTLLIIIIILILLFGGGGYYGYRGGYYGGGGVSIVGILLIFIVIWLLFGSGLRY
jgi:hypothetical protein